MIGIPLGLATFNAGEWLVHKHILHGLGRKKGTYWSFHWHEHHKNSRKEGFRDRDYDNMLIGSGLNAQTKEALGLLLGAGIVAPLLPVAPFFTGTMWYSAWRYYKVHKKAHQDPAWARERLTWHYDHHMGPNQDANWCVTHPWFDHVMGTRELYAGTKKEERDLERRARRKKR